MATKDPANGSWLPALIATFGSILGAFIGVRVAFVEGDKAIELETKKFELGLIEKALSTNEDRDSAINQIYFLIDLGLIETIQKETIQKLSLENLPNFRTTTQINDGTGGSEPLSLLVNEEVQWDEIEAWKNLHNAAAAWDLETAYKALSVLRRSDNKCVQRFSQDFTIELEYDGVNGFVQMKAIKEYYNSESLCNLTDNENTFYGIGDASILDVPLPLSPYEIPPFRIRDEFTPYTNLI